MQVVPSALEAFVAQDFSCPLLVHYVRFINWAGPEAWQSSDVLMKDKGSMKIRSIFLKLLMLEPLDIRQVMF